MYHNMEQLLALAKEKQLSLWQVVLENEQLLLEQPAESVFEQLAGSYRIMRQSAERAIGNDVIDWKGSLITGIAKKQYDYGKSGDSLCGGFLNLVMARALSCSEVNASMGKICAAPTAGACGILPAVLVSLEDAYQLERRTILEGLLTASGIGAVIVMNATVSGAEGGCQAECGVAAAMAAAAAVYLKGGSNEQQLHAVSFALINVMGLVCDPVAGLVQVPCAQRNASQSINALLSADMALSGTRCLIPVDEVIEAMYKTGKMLPMQLRETALGGIAATETGRKLAEKILSVN